MTNGGGTCDLIGLILSRADQRRRGAVRSRSVGAAGGVVAALAAADAAARMDEAQPEATDLDAPITAARGLEDILAFANICANAAAAFDAVAARDPFTPHFLHEAGGPTSSALARHGSGGGRFAELDDHGRSLNAHDSAHEALPFGHETRHAIEVSSDGLALDAAAGPEVHGHSFEAAGTAVAAHEIAGAASHADHSPLDGAGLEALLDAVAALAGGAETFAAPATIGEGDAVRPPDSNESAPPPAQTVAHLHVPIDAPPPELVQTVAEI